MTHFLRSLFVATAVASVLIPSGFAADDSIAAQAKKVFTERQDAVVWVSVVAKISMQAEGGKEAVNIPDREQKNEALGTLIDTNGLLVTALGSIDPSREYSGREIRTRDGMIKIEANAIFKEVRVTMPDGTEIPADVLMRDADLDLAFLRVKTNAKEAKGVEFKPVDLKNAATAGVSDDVITLSRNDETLNRVASVARGQVMSVTKKPREFLRVTGASLGCPSFAADGRLIGIAVTRTVRGKSSQTVLLPAADVLEIAEQARAAKPIEVKEEK
jgi:S1-C subfamily serine protease